jgi:hypothetical protein
MTELKKATTAKYKKPQPLRGTIHRFPRAMLEIAKVSQFGAEKHEVPMGDMGYLHVPDADVVYGEAEMRHILALPIEGAVNHGDGDLFHKAQKAWNALADLEVFLYRREIGSSLVEPDFQPLSWPERREELILQGTPGHVDPTATSKAHKVEFPVAGPWEDDDGWWFWTSFDHISRHREGPFEDRASAQRAYEDWGNHGNIIGGTD